MFKNKKRRDLEREELKRLISLFRENIKIVERNIGILENVIIDIESKDEYLIMEHKDWAKEALEFEDSMARLKAIVMSGETPEDLENVKELNND